METLSLAVPELRGDKPLKRVKLVETKGVLSPQSASLEGPLRKSVSMNFHPSLAHCCRSASISPTMPKKMELLSSARLYCSQEDLSAAGHGSKYKHSLTFTKSQSVTESLDMLPERGNNRIEGLLEVSKKNFKRVSKKTKDRNHPLHYPKNSEVLIEFLREGYDPNTDMREGFLPIHTYISRQKKKKYVDLLYTMLSHSKVDVECKTADGMSPLHMAIEEKNLHLIKLLLIFGANINSLNCNNLSPLDIAIQCDSEEIIVFLQSLGALQGEVIITTTSFDTIRPRLKTFQDKARIKAEQFEARRMARHLRAAHASTMTNGGVANGSAHNEITAKSIEASGINAELQQLPESEIDGDDIVFDDNNSINNGAQSPANQGDLELVDGSDNVNNTVMRRKRLFSNQSLSDMTLKDMEDGKTLSTLYERLQQCINIQYEISGSFSANIDEAIAITMQQKELLKYKKTESMRSPYSFNVTSGSRILFLDGGGIRGLIQIEILEQLEKKTGRKITELFDWIVGTSTGGIVALGLVYAKKSLAELRQLYFKMKDRVFGTDRLGFAFNTDSLEQLLKQQFGTTMTLSDVSFPRVIVTAVYKKTTIPELHFFNNCFDDDFSTQLVWKVARYTSAAPMFFREFEDYVDGGVLANNPCSYGLSAIQNYHRQIGEKLDIALVVSMGSGIFPAEDLGKTDAQEFLYFGKHWLRAGQAIKSIKSKAKSLITLLTTALVESEAVARSFKSRLHEQSIPFYRFNPQLLEVIPSGETDLNKLLNMLVQCKIYTLDSHPSLLDELVSLFYMVVDMDKKK